jgi:hypothetical protein
MDEQSADEFAARVAGLIEMELRTRMADFTPSFEVIYQGVRASMERIQQGGNDDEADEDEADEDEQDDEDDDNDDDDNGDCDGDEDTEPGNDDSDWEDVESDDDEHSGDVEIDQLADALQDMNPEPSEHVERMRRMERALQDYSASIRNVEGAEVIRRMAGVLHDMHAQFRRLEGIGADALMERALFDMYMEFGAQLMRLPHAG